MASISLSIKSGELALKQLNTIKRLSSNKSLKTYKGCQRYLDVTVIRGFGDATKTHLLEAISKESQHGFLTFIDLAINAQTTYLNSLSVNQVAA